MGQKEKEGRRGKRRLEMPRDQNMELTKEDYVVKSRKRRRKVKNNRRVVAIR